MQIQDKKVGIFSKPLFLAAITYTQSLCLQGMSIKVYRDNYRYKRHSFCPHYPPLSLFFKKRFISLSRTGLQSYMDLYRYLQLTCLVKSSAAKSNGCLLIFSPQKLPDKSTLKFSVSEEASQLAQADCRVANHAAISSTF